MSEGDVSLIRDEDVLRRMWQQTEDFSRKKEIRAHMYRLREERLRSLYSPEPSAGGKGVEAAQTHVKSLLDQSFQGLKSKEVRDAGSPPKEFHYRGQDLKELSNAGWNFESENKTTDDGHTLVKSVHANIEGKYDVVGGTGQFAAVDHQKHAATEYHDDKSSLKRNESSTNTAAHEQVVRKTEDGAQFSSTTNSSATSNFQQVSSTKHEVPYTNDDYDLSKSTSRNEERRQATKTADFEQNLRKRDFESGELVSKKVEYPDDSTKVIVETRCLPDGTRVTSTRREFRAPVQSTRSEHHSQSKSESSYSSTSNQRSDVKSSKITHESDSHTNDIVDYQRHADDYDFKRNQVDYSNKKEDYTQIQRSNQQSQETKKDTKQSSSKIVRQIIDNRNDVIDSTKYEEDHNIGLNQTDYSKTADYSTSDRSTNVRHETNLNEINKEAIITTSDTRRHRGDEHLIQKDDHITTDFVTNLDETDRQDISITNYNHNIRRKNDEHIHNITRDKKEVVVDKKTTSDQYQTTYQTDFTQKKISNDWSPSHQAWASTLRADTPSSIHPTTRASSPGSRTHRSSTSSLRSSVSPDKNYRKPSSRGGSPSKADRFSPSRTYTSPERKPPISANRAMSSPDRKPLDSRPRSSQSPEKRPQSYKPDSSPDRKPRSKSSPTGIHHRSESPSTPVDETQRSGLSLDKKSNSRSTPDSDYPRTTSPYRTSISPEKKFPIDTRRSQSPDKKSGFHTTSSPTSEYPRTISPSRPLPKDHTKPSTSPERKPGYQQTLTTRTSPMKESTDKYPKDLSPSRASVSPDRKPGYMRPTVSQDRKVPATHVPPQSPDRKTTNIKEDHYKFIDEETKMYARSDEKNINFTEIATRTPDRHSSPSPNRKTPKSIPDYCRPESPIRPTLKKGSRSPSPPKGPVTFTHDEVDKSNSTVTDIKTKHNYTKDNTARKYRNPNNDYTPTSSRETSPSKYGTYDKKHRNELVEEITITSSDSKDVKYDSLTRLEKSYKNAPASPTKTSPIESVSPKKSADPPREPSPSKYETYDKKRRSDKVEEVTSNNSIDFKHDSLTRREKSSNVPMSPTKKYPRDSVSPVKSPTKDAKYKHTTNFITTEKTTEEVNKRTANKNHPRQLVTPSTSPTRKPKTIETEPSTGQSSPTTSVSEFVYFSSPTTNKTIVTDLDDVEFYSETKMSEDITTTNKRPDTLPVERSSSPSKIPCRSPSPEKRVSPTKDNLPRKSSLKKPSTGFSPISPNEKPPSSFRVSPTDANEGFPEHNVVKKDQPDKPTNVPAKSKPPLERRETYEERCRKILGMVAIDTYKSTKQTSEALKAPKSNLSSPSVSPCYSPEPKENSTSTYVDTKKTTKINVTDFLAREQEDAVKKTLTRDTVTTDIKTKMPSRETSPAKLQDIISQKTVTKCNDTTENVQQSTISKKISHSPDREVGYRKPKDDQLKDHFASSNHSSTTPGKDKSPLRPSLSPERRPGHQLPTEKNIADKHHKESPRPSISPDRKPGYSKPTTTTTTRYDSLTTTEDVQNDSASKIIRQSHDRETGYPRSTSPSRPQDSKTNHVISPTDRSVSPSKMPREIKHSRTPSPTKQTTKVAEDITEFIQSEREQEILDRVQKSLRKLSPTRGQRSPSREKSPAKMTISLQDLDVTTENVTDKFVTEDDVESTEKQTTSKINITSKNTSIGEKPKEQKPASKPPSRNASPTKKPATTTASNPEKSPESLNKSRSISPKKPVSPSDRSQSPQVAKTSGIKPRESIPSQLRKVTSGNVSPTKTEKITTEVKNTTSTTKQNNFLKSSVTKTTTKFPSPTRKHEPELKRTLTPKGLNKENVSPKKEDTKVTRTASDASMKTKKATPQRMKSKPEIQVNDLSSTKTTKQSTTSTKIFKSQTKLAPKPKSATALNTSTDEDEIIIDVEQAKSSRENSPDRICPTPVSLLEDVGTPRFPDEVSEPDDDFCKRTHHVIHETESVVDDIVEICEDDELFVKNTDVDRFNASDECLLSVTDKVSKFTNKIDTVTKPKVTTEQFKETEKRSHSDFIDENIKSDECLLSVSEKVNKFAKGSRGTKDSRSPSRKIADEYDTETIYQDNYTKMSVNDKAHLFVETAENVKAPKTKPAQKVGRPDLSNVDESLKSDDCLLSVSDKVNKFVKTAEQFLTETHEVEDKEKIVKEQYEKIMKHIVQDNEDDSYDEKTKNLTEEPKITDKRTEEEKIPSFAKETTSSHTKIKDYASPNLKHSERTPTVKITTLRSSEAVKKAKALFENISSTTEKSNTSATKLTDIGVIKKSPKTDSTTVLHPSLEDGSPNVTDIESETDAPNTPTTKDRPSVSTPSRLQKPSRYDNQPEVPRTKSPMQHVAVETTTTTKTVLSRYPAAQTEASKYMRPETEKRDKPQDKLPRHPQSTEPRQTLPELEKDKPQEKVPSYQRPTITSQIKEEKTVEETEVSSRRGSGKFGVELRKTSIERSTVSSERRRSSTEHHQPCIEDIFDLDLLEQMLEKVVGYEQRRRIRAQMRIAKKRMETELTDTIHTKSTRTTTISGNKSPERTPRTKSPERQSKWTSQKTLSPERPKFSSQKNVTPEQPQHKEQSNPLLNGHAIPSRIPSNLSDKRQRPQSPEKPYLAPKTRSPVRHLNSDNKPRTTSPSKTPSKPKPNRFNDYASAYMRKVGLNDTDKVKFSDLKTKKAVGDLKTEVTKTRKSSEVDDYETTNQFEEKIETTTRTSTSKSFSERTSSKDTIEIVQVNGKRSLSPEKKRSPERQSRSPTERLYQRSPSPEFKRMKSDQKETIIKTVCETDAPRSVKKETIIKTVCEERPKIDACKKETIIKTVLDIEKKVPEKKVQEEKPSWVTNRNLKKTTSDTRTFSPKKVETERPKYRAPSPSKAISKPTDVITSSYGPGPVDSDGKPLFGIRALRNGASNYQVKGTVVRQEFHSRNGGEPQGSVSVTAYSTRPEELERLLRARGEPPSRLHGLAAITTTKKFGGDTGTTLKEAHSKEEHASLEQFTHSDRRVSDSRVEHVSDSRRERGPAKGAGDRGREERRERGERREDKKTVRQSSVKSLTEKYIKSASETSRGERSAYPKAGLILRSANMKDSVSSDSSAHAELGRADSAHSLASAEDVPVVTTTSTSRRQEERSFLDSTTKVSGVQDILTRMKNADIVVQEGDTTEDWEARALLNKFLGATVLMAGMQSYVIDPPPGNTIRKQEAARVVESSSARAAAQGPFNPEQCWDERVLRKHLEASTDYEQRRRLRARIRTLMAEQEACASAVTEALGAAGAAPDTPDAPAAEGGDAREEKEVTVTSSVRRNSSEKTVSSSTTTKSSKVIESMTRPAPKPVSPFAKFRQLEKQNSTTSPNSPQTPQSPGSPAQPYFKFTDPALQASALTIKERLLQWCRDKTRDYENVKLENFSTSWADGLAFCALVHHFLPDAFDYSKLTADKRRHNFTLAFKVADEKAGIYPLLDVDDMVAMRKPDWKCVFTYVQSIHRRFKDQQ